MRWVKVLIPESLARLVDATAGRIGVTRAVAISAALWIFGRGLTLEEKRSVILQYLEHGLPEEENNDSES